MSKNEEKMHLPKITLDDFLSSQEERDNAKLEKVQMIPLDKITDFPNHPYRVVEDDEMFNMAESVKKWGVIHPVIVRPKEDGTYEMISGHRRKRASEIAGRNEIKAIVREMTDEEAIITMVDSNKQREKVLPSEKAFAYKMKLEAMKRQGQRNDLTSVPLAQKYAGKTSREIIAEEARESQDQVRRYVRLTELIPELLNLVDEEKIKLRPAVEISYLTRDEQVDLLDAIDCLQATPSHAQAIRMKELSQKGELTADEINNILEEEKPNQKEQIRFKYDKVKSYFPKGYSIEQMQNVIEKLLENYQKQWIKERKAKEYIR